MCNNIPRLVISCMSSGSTTIESDASALCKICEGAPADILSSSADTTALTVGFSELSSLEVLPLRLKSRCFQCLVKVALSTDIVNLPERAIYVAVQQLKSSR